MSRQQRASHIVTKLWGGEFQNLESLSNVDNKTLENLSTQIHLNNIINTKTGVAIKIALPRFGIYIYQN